ncbi:hypothetical protein HO133_001893 [Letharia lupina]|uniref:Malic acid transport protein n=1 Tax=Letharia lupina TaxID=560253 RepID=A0A8H6CE53_9LECA|nr:uncharacterized protein HO133_001893 [Letharia lupina]KAF6221925.1 hypothetical protein HO133_001893 [Letharia lupina]
MHIPTHMLSPGQNGYRAPTVEDYHVQNGGSTTPNSARTPNGVAPPNDHSTPNSLHHRLPHIRDQVNLSTTSLARSILDELHWGERIRHYTWTFFTMTMATGGISNVLYAVPFRFRGLEAIGIIFFLLNIVLFIFNIVMISLRFYFHPETFKASFLHPTERLFIPAAVVSFGTILLNISQYGPSHAGDWLNDVVVVLFWVDAGLALTASMGVYLIMWSTASFTIENMTPIWIFPAYPLLIIGPHAAVLSQTLEQRRAFDIIVGGFTLQGIGFMVSLMIYSAFIYRLMTQRLPQASTRPGMFVSVGPCGFTVAGVIGMAEGAQRALPPDFMGNTPMSAMILKVISAWMSLWIWGLAFWFFFISAGAHWSCVGPHKMVFTMTWYSYVFPNTALVTSTFAIGKAFNSRAIQIIGCVMTAILILTWFFVVGMMVRAIMLKQILWPQKGEDKDEGGFKAPRPNRRISV